MIIKMNWMEFGLLRDALNQVKPSEEPERIELSVGGENLILEVE